MRTRITTLASWSLTGLLLGVGACGAMPDTVEGAGGGANEPIAMDASELPTMTCGIGDVSTYKRSTMYHQTPIPDGSKFCWVSDYRGGFNMFCGSR